MLFLASSGLFLFTFLSMFIRAFLTANFSTIYFSSFTHIFPFFAGSCLATVTGIANVSPNFTKLVQSWSMKKTLSVLGGSFAFLFVLSLFLPFDSLWTYLFGFLAATIAACAMILSARILHEKTPDKKNQPSSISWQIPVMAFTFSTGLSLSSSLNILGNMMAALVTTIVSLILTALSFYILEPTIAGKEPRVFGMKMDLSF